MATSYDPKCAALARDFLECAGYGSLDSIDELAQEIQTVIEDFIADLDADPSPYCSGCGAMTQAQCTCGPTDPMN